jgi:hypothetical protein
MKLLDIERCPMAEYLVQINVRRMSEELSRWLGCCVSAADVRELLRKVGFSESPLGWITTDVRPCLLAYLPPGATLF